MISDEELERKIKFALEIQQDHHGMSEFLFRGLQLEFKKLFKELQQHRAKDTQGITVPRDVLEWWLKKSKQIEYNHKNCSELSPYCTSCDIGTIRQEIEALLKEGQNK